MGVSLQQSGILEGFSKVLPIPISGMVELKEIGQRYLYIFSNSMKY